MSSTRRLSSFEHRVQDDGELSHDCGDDHFRGLATLFQAVRESLHRWIEAEGRQCRHIEARPDLTPPPEMRRRPFSVPES